MVRNYLCVWRQFNDFIQRLDVLPKFWEDRTQLFIAELVEKRKVQSSIVKSYVSAIKKMLINDGYKWDDSRILLSSFTRACKLINDTVKTRLPIHCGLLEVMLFEIEQIFRKDNQEYLEILYKSILLLGYYGLMRIGELTSSLHSVKARDIHIATNKEKILIVLYTSKTHDKSSRPQQIKITSNRHERSGSYIQRHFCPFQVLRNYLDM